MQNQTVELNPAGKKMMEMQGKNTFDDNTITLIKQYTKKGYKVIIHKAIGKVVTDRGTEFILIVTWLDYMYGSPRHDIAWINFHEWEAIKNLKINIRPVAVQVLAEPNSIVLHNQYPVTITVDEITQMAIETNDNGNYTKKGATDLYLFGSDKKLTNPKAQLSDLMVNEYDELLFELK